MRSDDNDMLHNDDWSVREEYGDLVPDLGAWRKDRSDWWRDDGRQAKVESGDPRSGEVETPLPIDGHGWRIRLD